MMYSDDTSCPNSSPLHTLFRTLTLLLLLSLQSTLDTRLDLILMTVLWGLDLHEIQWSKFQSSSIFSPDYHLRRTKMITYQLAMIFSICSEAVGTAALTGTYIPPRPYPPKSPYSSPVQSSPHKLKSKPYPTKTTSTNKANSKANTPTHTCTTTP